MTATRFTESGDDRFSIATPVEGDPIQVVCPACQDRAVVLLVRPETARVICSACGYSKDASTARRCLDWQQQTPTDGYFGLPLWLRTDCEGHSLWAFNRRHLELLEAYVSATLRRRFRDEDSGWDNGSLFSRLPRWMKDRKHRASIQKALAALKIRACLE